LAFTLLAAALRLPAAGDAPPGLYQDEAWNGLDALQVLAGERPLYFAANNGREPLFIYLVALSVGLLGRTPEAIRLVAVALGTLTIPATYALGRQWFNRRVGLLAATVVAITFWHVHLSRIGLRAVALPLVAGLALAAGWRGWRTHDRRWLILGGALYGLTFYTYLAARFTPLALALFALYLIRQRQHPTGNFRPRSLVWFVLAALVVVAPLALYALRYPDIVFARADDVLITNPAINNGDLWGTAGRHTLAVLGMFTFAGDTIWRHNLAGRPVFDPLLALAFVVGIAICLVRFRREPAAAFALIWSGVMLLPTLLAEDAPHFLRGVGVLPVAALFPALGLEAAWQWASRGRPAWIATVLVAIVLAASLALTVRDYFGEYTTNTVTGYYFQSAAAELAAEVNRTTGIGWDGRELRGPENATTEGTRVVLARRFWEGFASIRFLVPETGTLLIADNGAQLAGELPKRLFLWPYGSPRDYLSALPPSVQIRGYQGALARGDLEPQPYPLYVSYWIAPAGNQGIPMEPLARFEHGITLRSAQISGMHALSGQQIGWRVELNWTATQPITRDYTIFAHLLDGGQLLAQEDGPPGEGSLPTSWWRPGDTVMDVRVVPLPTPAAGGRIVVGLYDPATLQRLKVVDASGQPLGDSVEVR
jgi:4-amino-4-deoxy-L-arabinose transferase-like glycosyltransferase